MELDLEHLHDQIALWIDQGEPLATVEAELVEPATVSEDERAALWLFAWAYAKRRQPGSRPLAVVAP